MRLIIGAFSVLPEMPRKVEEEVVSHGVKMQRKVVAVFPEISPTRRMWAKQREEIAHAPRLANLIGGVMSMALLR